MLVKRKFLTAGFVLKLFMKKKTALPIGRAVVFYAVFKRIQAAKESEESNLLEE